ncbi:MAG: ABC transporter permease, partial [Chloroflexota bacterium]
MKLQDFLTLIFENLARRKGRVALTAVGVIIGTAAVVLLVSLGVGLQRNAAEQLGGIGDLTLIQVWPSYGEPMSGGEPAQEIISGRSLAEIGEIPGVTAVIPHYYFQGGVNMVIGRQEGWGSISGAGPQDLAALGLRAEQGTLELSRGTIIVGSQVANNFYSPQTRPGQEPPPPPDLFDKQLKITLFKWTEEGEVRKNVQARVVGVLAESRSEADWSVYMPLDEVIGLNTWVLGRRVDLDKEGYQGLVVKVGD